MNKTTARFLMLSTAFVFLFAARTALGHVTVAPRYSAPGEDVTYTIRVPTERPSDTVRVEAEFPSEVIVLDINPQSGWTIETRKDTDGRIIGAVWSGGSIPRGESVRLSFTAHNPTQETTISWKMVQIHADGSRVEWAPDTIVGSRTSGAD